MTSPPAAATGPGVALPGAGLPRTSLLRAGLLGAGVLLALPLQAQHVGSPLIPRGAVLFQLDGGYHQAAGLFGEDGDVPFGAGFFVDPADVEAFPQLAPVQDRIRALTGEPELSARAGRVAGRFEVTDQAMRLRAGYGILERISIAATVPLVRRSTDARVFLSGDRANIGLNPGESQAAAAFRAAARAALEELRGEVEAVCQEEGEESDRCLEGRAADTSISGFLDLLEEAWGEAAPFPLLGSDAGSALQNRWSSLLSTLSAWDAQGPEEVPLATTPLDDATFRRDLAGPTWGSEGFPLESVAADLLLGDVEAHLAVGIVNAPAQGGRPGIQSAVEATARFATGVPDSLILITPLEPPRGYGGGGMRWVTDLTLPGDRGGLLLTLGWTTYLERELTILAADPDDPWNPETAQLPVSGSPGDRLALGLVPRWSFIPGLSVGAGYQWLRRGDGRWVGEGGAPVASRPGGTQHRGVAEFRMAGWSSPLVEEMWFPAELWVRGIWTFSGDPGTPRERGAELGARILRRR